MHKDRINLYPTCMCHYMCAGAWVVRFSEAFRHMIVSRFQFVPLLI